MVAVFARSVVVYVRAGNVGRLPSGCGCALALWGYDGEKTQKNLIWLKYFSALR
jgi:hypothetical protein